MTQTASTTPTRYRVVVPLIQIRGESPNAERYPERTLRIGDVLPHWVRADELERLIEIRCIEAIA